MKKQMPQVSRMARSASEVVKAAKGTTCCEHKVTSVREYGYGLFGLTLYSLLFRRYYGATVSYNGTRFEGDPVACSILNNITA